MPEVSTKGIGKIIFSSSLGTLIEWYDFYIFGMLAKTIAAQFFPEGNDTAALLSTLAIFAAGFIVRPFGALLFGRLGDLVGRKYTFLLTLVLMGCSTFLIGLVPSYASIGMAAPLLVLLAKISARTGPGWRVRWCSHLCCGACTCSQARFFYGLDSDHRYIRLICGPGCNYSCKK